MKLVTLTERKTCLEIIRLIPDKTSKAVNQALGEMYFFALSITSDNGKEFARLYEVLECPIYYCCAYASHERATNENHNRRFWTASTTIKGKETIRGIYKKNRRNGTLFGFSVFTEIKILMGIAA